MPPKYKKIKFQRQLASLGELTCRFDSVLNSVDGLDSGPA